MAAPTVNYTTKIDVTKTVGELQELLGEHGADAIAIRYKDRRPVAVSFTLAVGGAPPAAYTLPIDVEAMRKTLTRQHRAGSLKGISASTAEDPEHAARVAWRVIKDWLAAQLSLVAAGQAELGQVMLPYLHVDGEITLYQRYLEQGGARALTAGGTS
jgi:hypothetical protein